MIWGSYFFTVFFSIGVFFRLTVVRKKDSDQIHRFRQRFLHLGTGLMYPRAVGALFYPRWAHFRNATAERISLSQVQYNNIMMAQC